MYFQWPPLGRTSLGVRLYDFLVFAWREAEILYGFRRMEYAVEAGIMHEIMNHSGKHHAPCHGRILAWAHGIPINLVFVC
jgi:hypothetical protein